MYNGLRFDDNEKSRLICWIASTGLGGHVYDPARRPLTVVPGALRCKLTASGGHLAIGSRASAAQGFEPQDFKPGTVHVHARRCADLATLLPELPSAGQERCKIGTTSRVNVNCPWFEVLGFEA